MNRVIQPKVKVALVQGEISSATNGSAAWEACSVTWNLGINSAFALGPRKTTANLDRVGQSQDLPDANWLLASSPTVTAIQTPDTRMNPKDVTGKYAVKNCGEACTLNYNTIGDDNYLHKSNHQAKPLTSLYKNDRGITKRCVFQYLEFQTMDSVAMKSNICCDVTTCILIEMYPCFGGAYCLRLRRQ
jgi:hypothetical protein